MGLDVTSGHAPCIEGNDFIIKTREATLTFGKNDRLKAGITVSGNSNIEISKLPFNSLSITAVAGVLGFLLCWGVFFLAKMFCHLSLHRSFQQLLDQLFK